MKHSGEIYLSAVDLDKREFIADDINLGECPTDMCELEAFFELLGFDDIILVS